MCRVLHLQHGPPVETAVLGAAASPDLVYSLWRAWAGTNRGRIESGSGFLGELIRGGFKRISNFTVLAMACYVVVSMYALLLFIIILIIIICLLIIY